MADNTVIVHDADGVMYEVSRANAIDLTRMGYTWGPFTAHATPVEYTSDGDTIPVSDLSQPVAEVPVLPSVDDKTKSLEELAKIIADQDAENFLKGMTAEQLRILSFSRYGETIHHKVVKDNAIEKILGFEKDLFAE